MGLSRPRGIVEGTRGAPACFREATITVKEVTYSARAVTRPFRHETCTHNGTVSRLPGGGTTIRPGPAMGRGAGGVYLLTHRAARCTRGVGLATYWGELLLA